MINILWLQSKTSYLRNKSTFLTVNYKISLIISVNYSSQRYWQITFLFLDKIRITLMYNPFVDFIISLILCFYHFLFHRFFLWTISEKYRSFLQRNNKILSPRSCAACRVNTLCFIWYVLSRPGAVRVQVNILCFFFLRQTSSTTNHVIERCI